MHRYFVVQQIVIFECVFRWMLGRWINRWLNVLIMDRQAMNHQKMKVCCCIFNVKYPPWALVLENLVPS